MVCRYGFLLFFLAKGRCKTHGEGDFRVFRVKDLGCRGGGANAYYREAESGKSKSRAFTNLKVESLVY